MKNVSIPVLLTVDSPEVENIQVTYANLSMEGLHDPLELDVQKNSEMDVVIQVDYEISSAKTLAFTVNKPDGFDDGITHSFPDGSEYHLDAGSGRIMSIHRISAGPTSTPGASSVFNLVISLA